MRLRLRAEQVAQRKSRDCPFQLIRIWRDERLAHLSPLGGITNSEPDLCSKRRSHSNLALRPVLQSRSQYENKQSGIDANRTISFKFSDMNAMGSAARGKKDTASRQTLEIRGEWIRNVMKVH